jgi:hypothetical protein
VTHRVEQPAAAAAVSEVSGLWQSLSCTATAVAVQCQYQMHQQHLQECTACTQHKLYGVEPPLRCCF